MEIAFLGGGKMIEGQGENPEGPEIGTPVTVDIVHHPDSQRASNLKAAESRAE